MPKMSLDTLTAILAAEKFNALGSALGTLASSKLTQERMQALNYYKGDMTTDLPSMDGRSSAVSMDVSDTVEGLMPSLMEIFCGGDEVVRFEPVGPEDVQAAEQETDFVNHIFMQKNPGFLILYSFIKDALLSKVGVVKVYEDTHETQQKETYFGLTPDQFVVISASKDVEVVEHTPRPDGLHDVKLQYSKSYKTVKAEAVPPEEFGVARRTRQLKDTPYCYHEVIRTESEMIDDGYSVEMVKKLVSYTQVQRQEAFSRDTVEEGNLYRNTETLNQATRPIRITEHYVRLDYKGDGQACLYRVTTGGEDNVVIYRDDEDEVVEIDFIPFAAMTPIPITHRFFGRSIADIVMDIQRIKTALLRSYLDNAYLANNPRIEVSEAHASTNTLDDLLVSRPGGIVRTKQPGGLTPLMHPDIGPHVGPLLEYMDATREWRTGVTRQGQGIDAKALQNQSATATNQIYNAAQARMKLIARIFAETGVRDLFSLLHATVRKSGMEGQVVRLRNQWVNVDPREWKERDDMMINVGLGSGGKAERLMGLNFLVGLQEKALAGGLSQLVQPRNLYNTAKEITKQLDLKTVEPYFTDPDSKEGQQAAQAAAQAPDPKMEEVKAKVQIEQQKVQADVQMQQSKAQIDAHLQQSKTEADVQSKTLQIHTEAELRRQQMAVEIELKREQFMAEIALKREQMAIDAELRREANRMQAATQIHKNETVALAKGDDGVSDVELGGEVG